MGIYSPEEIKLNKRYSILNGSYSAIAMNIYSGFLALYAIEALHATNQQVGLLSSLPQIMSLLAMIPGAMIINRLAQKKEFTVRSITIGRFFFLIIAIIPFLPFVDHAWMLVAAVALMGFPNSLTNLSWQSFISDLIPREDRNSFFSQRNRLCTFAAMISVLAAGVILNFFDKSNPLPYQFLYFLAFLLGMIEAYYLNRHIEIRREIKPKTQGKGIHFDFIKEMMKEKPYILFLGCAILINFGWQMAWPLFSIYNVEYAHASALWISLFSVVNQISQMVSFPYWGKYADKYGNSSMLFLASLGLATAPVLTILSTNLYYLLILNLWSGIAVAGITMLLFNQLLHVSPDERNTTYIAGYQIAIGLVGFISPQVGVWLLEILDMNVSMWISTVMRLVGAFSFLAIVLFFEKRKKEAGSQHISAS